MEIRRVILYAAFALIAYTLWADWQKDFPPPITKTTLVTNTHAPTSNVMVPLSDTNTQVANDKVLENEQMTVTSTSSPEKIISVKTDVLDLAIDLQHGNIMGASLLDYPVSVEEKDKPFPLLQSNASEQYVANSSLFIVKGTRIENQHFNYTSAQDHYQMSPDKKQLVVTLIGNNADGITVKKEFVFTKGQYLIDVHYQLANQGAYAWKGYMNMQLLRRSPKEDKSSMFHVGSYTGASYSNPGQKRYQKVNFKDMDKSTLELDVKGGWIAMQQHYFLTAWVPGINNNNRFYTQANDGTYTIGAVSQPILLAPGQSAEESAKLYLGPEITSDLKAIAPGLDLTVDYGILWFVSSLLFSLMKAIYNVVGNWGWSIVLVTVLVKLVFYRLSATSYKSMANMRKLQPKLQALRERYGDDKAKISQATMALYKQEKVNPLGGCLPIVIQIPVFIALYWVLLESVELRQAPFILWINDLAAADPYHILPIIMGSTMLVQQKLNPAPPDPMQAKVMMFLPILFTALFWNFPAGLVLYWIVNNSLSILQQWYISHKFSEDKPKNKLVTAK